MHVGSHLHRPRCLAVWTAATGGLALVARLTWGPISAARPAVTGGHPGATPLDAALSELAAVVLLGCAGWMWLVTTLVVLEARRGVTASVRPRGAVPHGVRRAVLAACGLAFTSGLGQPALAVAAHAQVATVPERADHRHPRLTGLPLPDRAVAPPRRGAAHTPRTLRVVPGDTLWSIAARELPPGSAAALVVDRWHAIYAANRSLIGPDPDVILPGQRLRLPGKDPS